MSYTAKKMPKLLIITTVPSTIRAFLLPFARHYRSLGWRVDCAANGVLTMPELQSEFDACYELPLSRSPFDVGILMAAPSAIRALVQAGDYDLVHVHTPIAAFLVRFALKDMTQKTKVVYTAHGFHFHKYGKPLTNFIFKSLEKLAAPWCDALVLINQEDYRAAKQAHFATRIEYMAGIGIDTKLWQANTITDEQIQELRQTLALSSEDVLFLMVAEFNIGKRHADALQALVQTPAQVHLAFAGIGVLQEKIKLLAKQLGLESRVHFLGFRRDMPLLMRASRAVILPSEREGLPRSLLEAMSLSVPIIGANIRGVAELTSGDCGFSHDVGNVQQLAEAMHRLAENSDLAQRMGENARAKVLVFDIKDIIRNHDALYAELLR